MNKPINTPRFSCEHLCLDISAYSSPGIKSVNQDAFDFRISQSHRVNVKPSAQCAARTQSSVSFFVIADGVSSSTISQVASDFATARFSSLFELAPEHWDIRHTASTLIKEINALLYTRNQQSVFCYTPEKGYVCTFTVLVIDDDTLHIFHVGDCQIQLSTSSINERLTQAHRQACQEQPGHSYLTNALGVSAQINIDYIKHPIRERCTIAMSTDGVHDFINMTDALTHLHGSDTFSSDTAKTYVDQAMSNNSDDNLTLILIKLTLPQVEQQKCAETDQSVQQSSSAVLPMKESPHVQVGDVIDGLMLKRQLYTSARSHIFIAKVDETSVSSKEVCADTLAFKTLATELLTSDGREGTEEYSAQHTETWLARRINSKHVVKYPTLSSLGLSPTPSTAYCLSEYVEGQTLAQWMLDNPSPTLEKVRRIVEQIATGLQAMHRQGVLHRDIRPENIMINDEEHCTIIDLGAAGLIDAPSLYNDTPIPGDLLYTAPEYFIGDVGTELSDQFSLAVLCYTLLCGRYPYGTKLAHCRTRANQQKLKYQSAIDGHTRIPQWLDGALKRALHINPEKRFAALSEFIYALRYPTPHQYAQPLPLVKRNPLTFYKALALILVFTNLITVVLLL